MEFDLDNAKCRGEVDEMLRLGMTNEQICEAFGLPSEPAFRQALSRARIGIVTTYKRRRLVDLPEKAKEDATPCP